MKTNDFIKKVEELGFTTKTRRNSISVHDQDGFVLVNVRTDAWLGLDSWLVVEKLFDLAVEYVKTPIDEREEPKKYYLRHKYLTKDAGYNFLNFDKYDGECLLNTNKRSAAYQTEFTREEINNLPFEVIVSEWELIEVTEWK